MNPLREAITSLPLPTHYFKGQRSHQSGLPENVLCWHPHELEVGRFQHFRFVLMMAARGSVTVFIDEHNFRLSPGQAILCFPFQQHSFVDADEDRAWLFTTFEWKAHQHLGSMRNTLLKPSNACWGIANDLIGAYKQGHREHKVCILTALLVDELSHCRAERAQPIETGDRNRAVLDEVNRYIWSHLHEPIQIPEVAEACSISPSHLRLLFRTAFKNSLGRYIRDTKINRSRDLLATTDKTVSEVAYACGYDSIYAFSRAFKNSCGITPSEYRKQAAAGKID